MGGGLMGGVMGGGLMGGVMGGRSGLGYRGRLVSVTTCGFSCVWFPVVVWPTSYKHVSLADIPKA